MELFLKLFGDLLVFVYHCFDRIVIHGYLSGLSRPEQVVHFFRRVVGVPVMTKEVLSQRTADYQNWVEAFAPNRVFAAQPDRCVPVVSQSAPPVRCGRKCRSQSLPAARPSARKPAKASGHCPEPQPPRQVRDAHADGDAPAPHA